MGEGSVTNDDQIPEWIEAARRGDEQSFLNIYRSYSGKVRGLLRQMLGSENLDDHVQEVFLRVWRGIGSLRETAAFSGWIYKTAWNVALDFRKTTANRRHQSDEYFEHLSMTHRAISPEGSMSAKILVDKALGELDFEHRGVVVLVDLEDFSLEKTSEIMNIPVGTVKSRLFHARNRLRKYLEAKGVEL